MLFRVFFLPSILLFFFWISCRNWRRFWSCCRLKWMFHRFVVSSSCSESCGSTVVIVLLPYRTNYIEKWGQIRWTSLAKWSVVLVHYQQCSRRQVHIEFCLSAPQICITSLNMSETCMSNFFAHDQNFQSHWFLLKLMKFASEITKSSKCDHKTLQIFMCSHLWI